MSAGHSAALPPTVTVSLPRMVMEEAEILSVLFEGRNTVRGGTGLWCLQAWARVPAWAVTAPRVVCWL